jgi:hypothetical protein
MAMLSFGGIDVSKDRLDITVLPDEQCSSVSNDAAGWAELIEQLRFHLVSAQRKCRRDVDAADIAEDIGGDVARQLRAR